MLLHYFGEDDSHNCGCCDYCLSRSGGAMSSSDFSEMRGRVLDSLSAGSLSVSELLVRIGGEGEKVLHVLRLMQDKGRCLRWMMDGCLSDFLLFLNAYLLKAYC